MTRAPNLTRVFIDSTVFFSACASAIGASRSLLDRGFAGLCQLCFSSLVLQETETNLRDKRPQALPQFAIFRAYITMVSDPDVDLVLRAMRVVAIKDAPIVAAASVANATYLVTLDQRHILAKAADIHAQFGLSAVTPGDALARLRSQSIP